MKPNTFSVIVRIWNDEEEPYYEKNDKQYYYDRRRIVGDYHGQAPLLWCCFALIE